MIAVAGAVLALAVIPTAIAAGGSANLWVDANGGSCARRAAPRPYADGRACKSLAAAYRAARAGDTIRVRAGTYGPQRVPGGTKAVTIRNAAGARPVLGTTVVDASNISLIGFTIRRNDDPGDSVATLQANGDRNKFRGVRVDSRNQSKRQGIYAGGDGNLFRNGSTYNVVDSNGALVAGTSVTFNHFNFRDVRVTDELVHNDCVYSNGPKLTVKNSHFWNCATTDLFITRGTWWTPPQPMYGGITLINNVFEHSNMETAGSWHYYGLKVKTDENAITELRNWRVINNTFETEVGAEGLSAPGTIWANNIGSWSCFPQATFSHNVGKKCSASDKRVSPAASCGRPACATPRTAAQRWINPARHNFHLRLRAAAINAAARAYAPRLDRDGRRRGSRPDAGAYEFRR